jgi:hypothetical protein
MSLFRWASAPIDKLIAALDERLAGFSSRDGLDVRVSEFGEFVVDHKGYGFQHHTFVYQSEGRTLERMRRSEHVRVAMLTRALIEELQGGTKLFVYHDIGKSSLADIRRLHAALNAYGRNTLLWIVSAPPGPLVDTAQEIEPGLIQGRVAGFQVEPLLPKSPYLKSWLTVACAAHRIWSQERKRLGSSQDATERRPA